MVGLPNDKHTPPMLSEIVEILQIVLKYGDTLWPTICVRDKPWICNVDVEAITAEDRVRLEELGLRYNDADKSYTSYAFGSA